jgi:uncharacterized protein (DUF58 family)
MPASKQLSSSPKPNINRCGTPGRARQLQILSTRLVTSLFAGAYRSVFRGRGIEFEELRDYQPGDDIRCIDWNVTARTGQPYIKRFVEEREMTVMLMLDRSASLNCPSAVRPKSEVAAEICALLAGAAARSNDRIGLLTFSEGIERYIPPGKGLRHTRRLIAEIALQPSATGGTDLAGALGYLQRVTRRPLILFIISDFISSDFRRDLTVITRRNDVVAVTISDPHDLSLPNIGLLQIADPETGLLKLIDTSSPGVRSAYAGQAAQRQASLRHIIATAGADLLPVSTTIPPEQVLSFFFKDRQRRISVSGQR